MRAVRDLCHSWAWAMSAKVRSSQFTAHVADFTWERCETHGLRCCGNGKGVGTAVILLVIRCTTLDPGPRRVSYSARVDQYLLTKGP